MFHRSSNFPSPIRTWPAVLSAFFVLMSFGGLAFAEGGGGSDPSNPENPWDHVGQLHNELLDYVAPARASVGDRHAPLATAMVGRALEFAANSLEQPCSPVTVDMDAIASIVADGEAANDVVSAALSDAQVAYFLRLDEIASRLHDDTESALEEMRALEAEIADALPEEDAAPLLIGASVGRYSHHYWSEQADLQQESPWLVGTELPPAVAEAKIPKWLKADLKGAIKGAAGGVGGGIGGMLWGALIGGGVASAIELIDEHL